MNAENKIMSSPAQLIGSAVKVAAKPGAGRTLIFPILLGLLLAFGPSAHAQDYSVNWWTVDGGGRESTGGPYSLNGTIGQPDAGRITEGNYTLLGGFWGVVGSPRLSITRLNNTVRISWPLWAADYVLEETPHLHAPIPWGQVPSPYVTGATDISITVPAPVGTKFYRLHKP